MGVLTEFFVASDAEVHSSKEQLQQAGPCAKFVSSDLKGVTVQICRLEAILTGTPYEECLDQMLDPFLGLGEDGPWVWKISDNLVARINVAQPHELAEAAAKWTESAEMHGWAKENVAVVVENLHDLAASALTNNKHMFLWISSSS
jgi:hypothetical protein